ncbi:MAG: hypothetical protein IJR10_03650 [Clostridia bacterium]|nr:hypothetical protein [Clostridia bacterium]
METTKRPRIIYLLLAAMFIVTAAVAMPTTNAKYSTTKTYNIAIQSIVKNKSYRVVRTTAVDKTVNFSPKYDSATDTKIPSSVSSFIANTTNSNTAPVYIFWSDQSYTIDGKTYSNSYTREKLDGSTTYHYKGTAIENFIKTNFNATKLNDEITNHIVTGSRFYGSSTYTYTVGTDLTEGWYYIKIPYYKALGGYGVLARNTRYCFSLFYLPAAQVDSYENDLQLNPEKIAMFSGGRIVFTLEENGFIVDQYAAATKIVFSQARFTTEEVPA